MSTFSVASVSTEMNVVVKRASWGVVTTTSRKGKGPSYGAASVSPGKKTVRTVKRGWVASGEAGGAKGGDGGGKGGAGGDGGEGGGEGGGGRGGEEGGRGGMDGGRRARTGSPAFAATTIGEVRPSGSDCTDCSACNDCNEAPPPPDALEAPKRRRRSSATPWEAVGAV